MAPKPKRLTRRSPPKGNVPAAAAFGLASWSVMRLPSASDLTDSTVVRLYRWERSNQFDGTRMTHILYLTQPQGLAHPEPGREGADIQRPITIPGLAGDT
jgi:hypothetical protein